MFRERLGDGIDDHGPAQEAPDHQAPGPPSRQGPLSAAFCRTVAQSGRYADGNGLYLHVDPSGARRWVQRLVIRGRSRALGLGSYALVSLAEAREKALANRKAAREGGDRLADRRRSEGIPTFEEAVEQVIAIRGEAWRAGKTPKQWRASLREHVLPHLGGKSVDQVTTADVMTVLLPLWTQSTPWRGPVRQRIGTVMRWAIAQGYRSDNPAGDAVTAPLPKRPVLVQHRAALPHGEVAAAIAAVQRSAAWVGTKLAFEFLVLTAARSGEARGATWDEVDLVARVWTIPAARMKAQRERRVPLCGRAAGVLREAEQLRGVATRPEFAGLVFPSVRGKALDDAAVSKLIRGPGHRGRASWLQGPASGTGRPRRPTTRARSSRRRWPTRCETRSRRPTRGPTCSRAAAS